MVAYISAESWKLIKRAFLPLRSASVTPRAFAHPPQTFMGIPNCTTFWKVSFSGGHPTGLTELITASRMRTTASPASAISTSSPRSLLATAWRKGIHARVGFSEPTKLWKSILVFFFSAAPAEKPKEAAMNIATKTAAPILYKFCFIINFFRVPQATLLFRFI